MAFVFILLKFGLFRAVLMQLWRITAILRLSFLSVILIQNLDFDLEFTPKIFNLDVLFLFTSRNCIYKILCSFWHLWYILLKHQGNVRRFFRWHLLNLYCMWDIIFWFVSRGGNIMNIARKHNKRFWFWFEEWVFVFALFFKKIIIDLF